MELGKRMEQLEGDIKDGRKKLQEAVEEGVELEDLIEIVEKIKAKKKELGRLDLLFDYEANDRVHEEAVRKRSSKNYNSLRSL